MNLGAYSSPLVSDFTVSLALYLVSNLLLIKPSSMGKVSNKIRIYTN